MIMTLSRQSLQSVRLKLLFFLLRGITGCILGNGMCDVWWIKQHRGMFVLVYVGTIAIFKVVGSRSTTIVDINEIPAAELINRR